MKKSLYDDLSLIRSMTVLATEVVEREEISDSVEVSRLPEARIVLKHVEQLMFRLEETYDVEQPPLKLVKSGIRS